MVLSHDFICAYGDPADTGRPSCDEGIMGEPIPIADVFLLDKAHCFVSGLHWTKKLEEILLWRLYAVPSGMDDLSDSLE